MLHLVALVGIVSISFSGVFVRLAAVSPVTAAFYRAAYAIPLLALLTALGRPQAGRGRAARTLAVASGMLLALDLSLWHESIARIGVGLATVIANVQVVFVGLVAWLIDRERPTPHQLVLMAAVLAGLILISGLAQAQAYGLAPVSGAALGVLAGGCYAGFLLTFRRANRALAPPAGPLLEATIGTAAGALGVARFDPGFVLAPGLPEHVWLVALAVVSQAFGWLLIATALPRLPALETSILLLVQPVFALIWGVVFFAERLSVLQWLGAAAVLAGVGTLSITGAARVRDAAPPP
jgi:drug/metabolite transporter (DMT)-like permease